MHRDTTGIFDQVRLDIIGLRSGACFLAMRRVSVIHGTKGTTLCVDPCDSLLQKGSTQFNEQTWKTSNDFNSLQIAANCRFSLRFSVLNPLMSLLINSDWTSQANLGKVRECYILDPRAFIVSIPILWQSDFSICYCCPLVQHPPAL